MPPDPSAHPTETQWPQTLAELLREDPEARIDISCARKSYVGHLEQHKALGHYGGALRVQDLIWKLGAETTVFEVAQRATCLVCRARWPDITVRLHIRRPGYSDGGYAYPE